MFKGVTFSRASNDRLCNLIVSLPGPSIFTYKFCFSVNSTATLVLLYYMNASYLPNGLTFSSSQIDKYWETIVVGARLLTILGILTISPEASFIVFPQMVDLLQHVPML